MKIYGFSDAVVRVVKTGPGVREQGELCFDLGEEVAPRIFELLDDGYIMEMLSATRHSGLIEFIKVGTMLEQKVWNRPPRGAVGGWLRPLLRWSEKAPWITPCISRLYPSEPRDGYSMIHGDPTLANLMVRRGSEELIISDPMPRMDYRCEIPERPEVDVGKLIQSTCGWEAKLGMNYAQDQYTLGATSTGIIPLDLVMPGILWGAIHLARVALRAPGRGHPEIAAWAEDQSRHLVDWFEENF